MAKTSETRGRRSILAERRHWLTAGLLVLSLALLIPAVTTLMSSNPATGAPGNNALEVRDTTADLGEMQPAPEAEVYAALEPGFFDAPEAGEGWEASADPPSEEFDGDPGTLNCMIEPSELIDIRSAVEGRLEVVHVERSDTVEKGQVLVELETGVELAAADVARTRATITGAIQSREANLMLTSSRRKRAQNLFEQQALSVDIREEIETQAQVAELDVQEARENKRLAELEHRQAMAVLDRRTLRSPISGVVTERLMSAGEVADEDTILRLAQVDPLRVEVVLPAARFGTVKQGMRAAVIPEFPGDQVHIAAVTIVDRVIDGASSTFGVRLDLPNTDYAIPSGLHCQVRFLAE